MLRDLYEARKRRKFKEAVGGVVISSVLAATAGAVAGLLLAPQSGKETREDLKEGARELKDEMYIKGLEVKDAARDTVEDAKAKGKEFLDTAEDKAKEAKEKGEELVDEAGDKVEEAKLKAELKAEDVKEDVKDKAEDAKEATEDLKDDLKDKNKEVKKDAKRFGRKVGEEYEVKDAKGADSLKYNVCEPTDMSCKVPKGGKKKK